MGKKFKHSDIFPSNPMLMCICGSSGCGKTYLTFNMLTTPNLLDFESLYIYTTTPEQSYYQFLKALEYVSKEEVQDIFHYYESNEDLQENAEIKDILDGFIKEKNPSLKPTDVKVFLTKNVNDLDLSKIDNHRKNLIVFDDCVAQKSQTVQQEFFTKGRHHNCHCIYQSQSFYGMDAMFIRKNANCFLLFELNEKDLSQIIQSINHGMDRDTFKKTLFQPILKSQEDIKKRLAIEPSPHKDPPLEYGGIKTLDDIKRLFSNPDPDLPKSISPIIDEVGLLFNGFRIRFSGNSPQFKIDTKDFIFTLTRGLIDLMNGEDVKIADYKDLVAYSKFLHAIGSQDPKQED
ncbi:hypothetical protein LOTGIDRAFT_173755 [Lottia gigantea]|uniref:Uncharacterized protein n=1 Tax=Lottia gigantea TaxID=225164 RepID=V4AZU3_LOTGI|nr:hypothetical protein LOTGIDRAFT_173755 [Lottia gigantea]ESO99266.1 hypothetical protein LOTGIDRAFT_173755 [Lottia gigantea]